MKGERKGGQRRERRRGKEERLQDRQGKRRLKTLWKGKEEQ